MEQFCQSCGMPLMKDGKHLGGTESDGSQSHIYCNLCYKDGKFIEPDISYEEMLARGKQGIADGDGNAVTKFMMKTFYPMQLKKLDRWRK